MISTIDELVHRFYAQAWNRWDDSVVEQLLAPDFEFRGSLGESVHGPDGWRGYRDLIRAGVPDFHNEIVDLIVEPPNRAAVRLRYTGHHRGPLLGIQGTGRPIDYAGVALFTAEAGLLTRAWVLGDLDGLRRQLG